MTEVAAAPELTIVPANSSVSLTGNYTLVMADADVVGTNEANGQTRHWLVNGVVLKAGAHISPTGENFFFSFSLSNWIYLLCPGNSSSSFNVSTANGTAVTDYAGPAPPTGSGPHR